MKQIYFFVLAVLMSFGLAANAQTYTWTADFVWDNPNAITLKYNNVLQNIGDATSWHKDFTAEEMYPDDPDEAFTASFTLKSVRIDPANGYTIDEVYYMDGDTKVPIVSYNSFYNIAQDRWRNKTIHIVTSLPVPDASVNVNIAFLPNAVQYISINGGNDITNFVKGNNTLEFVSKATNTMVIGPSADAWVMVDGEKKYRRFYSIKKGDVDISDTYVDWKTAYSFEFNDGDVITITPLEEDPTAGQDPEDLYSTVTFDFSQAPEGLFKNIFYNSKFIQSLSDLENNQLQVEKGKQVRVNFNDDFIVSSVTYNDEPVDSFDNGSAKFTPTASGTLKVVATEKAYGTKVYTAYIVCPEGVTIANGNFLTGDVADLSTGFEAYTGEDVTVVGIDGEVATFDIPAANIKKYTLRMSDKYDQIAVKANDGYWMKAYRRWDTQKQLEGPQGNTYPLLIVAKKIENDASVKVYIDKALDPTMVQLRPNKVNGSLNTRKFTQTGFTTVEFDSEYEPSFSVICNQEDMVDNSGTSPKPLYDATIFDSEYIVAGRNMIYDGENYVYGPAAMPDGGILRIAPQLRKTVKITREKYVACEAMQGANWESIELPAVGESISIKEYALYPLSFYVDPNSTEVWVDEVKQEAEEGLVSFYITDNNKVQIKYVGQDPTVAEFTPAAGEVESLEEIRISFPNASSVSLALDEYGDEVSADMIRLSVGNSWAPIYASIEQDWNAEVPTFVYKPYPVPAMPYTYSLMIPSDFFTFNNAVDNADNDITGQFTLKVDFGEIEYTFEPAGFINKEYTEWGVQVAIAFGENQIVSSFDRSKFHATFNGEPIGNTDVEYRIEYNFLMLSFSGEKYGNQVGTLALTLDEGAITLADGQTTEAMEYSWQICEPVELVYEVSHNPEDYDTTANKLTISVIFPAYDSVEVFNENGAVLKEDNYNANNYHETGSIRKVSHQEASPAVRAVSNENNHVFAVEFPLPTKEGDYVLDVRPGTFTINGFQESDAINKTYKLNGSDFTTGINGVISDMINGNIYNTQGVKINTNVKDLPAGVYIVNGKKVIVK